MILHWLQTGKGIAAAPPFTLADIKNAIPDKCLKKNAWRSMGHLAADVAIVAGLAVGAYALNQWYVISRVEELLWMQLDIHISPQQHDCFLQHWTHTFASR